MYLPVIRAKIVLFSVNNRTFNLAEISLEFSLSMLKNLYVRRVYKYADYGLCAFDGTRIHQKPTNVAKKVFETEWNMLEDCT